MKMMLMLFCCLFLVHCTSTRIVLPRQFNDSLPLEERKELYSKNKLTYKSGFLGAPRFKIGDQPADFSEYQVTAYFLTSSSAAYVQYENALTSQGLSALFYTVGITYTALGSVYLLPSFYSTSFNTTGIASLLLGGLSLITGIIMGIVSINQFMNAVLTHNFDLQEKLSLKKGELSFGGNLDQLGLFYNLRF